MRVKPVLPALTEVTNPHLRPIEYELFPLLGLATLAARLGSRWAKIYSSNPQV